MTTPTLTITEFLLARITEDELEIGPPVDLDESAGPNGIGWADVGGLSDVLMSSRARAWAECEAKRRIIEAYIERDQDDDPRSPDYWDVPVVLEHLAKVYADHPDFDPEWRL